MSFVLIFVVTFVILVSFYRYELYIAVYVVYLCEKCIQLSICYGQIIRILSIYLNYYVIILFLNLLLNILFSKLFMSTLARMPLHVLLFIRNIVVELSIVLVHYSLGDVGIVDSFCVVFIVIIHQ